MKKIVAVFIALFMCAALCACGAVSETMELIDVIGEVTLQSGNAIETAEAAYAELDAKKRAKVENAAVLATARETYDRIKAVADQIDAIGEVTVESESAITAAEEAYSSLTEEEKAKVENYAALTAAYIALDEAIKVAEETALREPYAGEWLSEIEGSTYITLHADGTAVRMGETLSWALNEDGTSILVDDGSTFTIIEEDSFTKIVLNDSDYFVLSTDYRMAFDKKFTMKVELTSENVRDYLGDPVLVGYQLDNWGEPKDENSYCFYYLSSNIYDEGWVYADCSGDFAIDIVYNTGFTMTLEDGPFDGIYNEGRYLCPTQIGNRVRGTLYYIRKECVAKNYMIGGTGSDVTTRLELKSGKVYETSYTPFSDNGVSFDYQDFLR